MNLEVIRRAARGVLGYQSPPYRLAARVLTQYQILRREGWNTTRHLSKIMATSGGSEVALNLRSLRHPIFVRAGTDDVPVVIDNAIREEYGQFASNLALDVIVDAGAYIGDTSAYFLSRFPASRVIALEPNQDSYSLALRNLHPYGDRVSLLKAALWTEVTTVRIGGVQTRVDLAPEKRIPC